MILSYELEEQRKKPENYFHNTTIGVNPYRTQLLKWIGNKQRVAHEIISFFPKRFGTYFEPFVGSSAVLSVLSPKKGEASDSFAPLIAIWQTLKTNPDLLKLWYRDRWHELQNGEKVKQYEKIKSRYNAEKKPADLLILSRAAYGGVMRFRMYDGYMSTPCGVHSLIHPSTFGRRVDEWYLRLKDTDFFHREYEESLDRARCGDVVYCDPPYSHSQAILYGAQKFSQNDLFKCIEKAKKKGVFVALSLDDSKKSGREKCLYDFPKSLFEKEVSIQCGHSMLRRFQMAGKTLESEQVKDRLLLTH